MDLAPIRRSEQVKWQLALQSATTSVPQARHWVLDHYREHSQNHRQDHPHVDAQLVDLLALLGTELVANAVLHGAPPVVLSLEVTSTAVWVGCSDSNPQPPVVRVVGLDATGGRGLALIDALAGQWGVTPLDVQGHDTADAQTDADAGRGGKEVWFQLDMTPTPTTTAAAGAAV